MELSDQERPHQDQEKTPQQSSLLSPLSPNSAPRYYSNTSADCCQQATQWLVKKFELKKRLGVGANGEVWLVELTCTVPNNTNNNAHNDTKDMTFTLAAKKSKQQPVPLPSVFTVESLFEMALLTEKPSHQETILPNNPEAELQRTITDAEKSSIDAGILKCIGTYTYQDALEGAECYALFPVCDHTLHDTLNNTLSDEKQKILSLEVLHGLTRALITLEKNGYVHRDIKPENILLRVSGTSWGYCLSDFGTACKVARRPLNDEEQSTTPLLIGTPAYMAPEAIKLNAATLQTDIFSVAQVLNKILGKPTAYEAIALHTFQQKDSNTPSASPLTNCVAIADQIAAQHTEVVFNQESLKKCADFTAAINYLIQGMSHSIAKQRPSVTEIATACDFLTAQLKTESKIEYSVRPACSFLQSYANVASPVLLSTQDFRFFSLCCPKEATRTLQPPEEATKTPQPFYISSIQKPKQP